MAKNHMKRLVMPTTWTTQQKKGIKFVTRGKPGAHKLSEGMPIVLILREMLHIANTAREVKEIMNHQVVLVDGTQRKDHRYQVGLMDTISLPATKQSYRVSINTNGRLSILKIDEKEAKEKVCKIQGKGLYQGKTQLQLSDGRSLLVEKGNYKTGDSVVITVPDQKIQSHISFEKGATVLLTGGKRIGVVGTIEDIKENMVAIKAGKESFETAKKYCFVVGKQKPALTIN
ncbi:MAG TPA: 30S ribosomal protein S4e [Candidatus Nanoarchaeia archaeon]|nr:30S ribosomal protein S4e [Candidatus Nanoarchaeia archaeon]